MIYLTCFLRLQQIGNEIDTGWRSIRVLNMEFTRNSIVLNGSKRPLTFRA